MLLLHPQLTAHDGAVDRPITCAMHRLCGRAGFVGFVGKEGKELPGEGRICRICGKEGKRASQGKHLPSRYLFNY